MCFLKSFNFRGLDLYIGAILYLLISVHSEIEDFRMEVSSGVRDGSALIRIRTEGYHEKN